MTIAYELQAISMLQKGCLAGRVAISTEKNCRELGTRQSAGCYLQRVTAAIAACLHPSLFASAFFPGKEGPKFASNRVTGLQHDSSPYSVHMQRAHVLFEWIPCVHTSLPTRRQASYQCLPSDSTYSVPDCDSQIIDIIKIIDSNGSSQSVQSSKGFCPALLVVSTARARKSSCLLS